MADYDVTQMRKFVSPEIIFGVGARLSVANYAKTFGAKKVLIVSDSGVKDAGWLGEVENLLSDNEIDWVSFTDVSPNPRVEEVMKGAEFYLAGKCNMIVAVGGGSPMDCAKGIGIVATNGKSIRDFQGVDMIGAPIPPLIFIPTTSGTSADVSQFAIISDQRERFKFSIISKAIVPDVALVDPKTASSMDPYLTACTGLDALVHAIEAFVSTGAGPLTDMYALDAIRLIYRNLPLLISEPDDMQLREQVMLGSMKAGLAFSNAILGAVHAMSHSLGGYLDLPHGLCNAMLLEHVIAYNFPNAEDRFKIIAQEMNIDIRGLSSKQVMHRLVQQVTLLKQQVGIIQTLSVNGVTLTDIPVLSEKALIDPCLITNPRPSNKRDLETVYEEAL